MMMKMSERTRGSLIHFVCAVSTRFGVLVWGRRFYPSNACSLCLLLHNRSTLPFAPFSHLPTSSLFFFRAAVVELCCCCWCDFFPRLSRFCVWCLLRHGYFGLGLASQDLFCFLVASQTIYLYDWLAKKQFKPPTPPPPPSSPPVGPWRGVSRWVFTCAGWFLYRFIYVLRFYSKLRCLFPFLFIAMKNVREGHGYKLVLTHYFVLFWSVRMLFGFTVSSGAYVCLWFHVRF